jgi:hypothetical protein
MFAQFAERCPYMAYYKEKGNARKLALKSPSFQAIMRKDGATKYHWLRRLLK